MEVYIDDMLVKSQQAGDQIQHLSNTFQILRKFNMKLNPKKCAFSVSLGKFLGFLVSNRDIEVNPVQIKAIEEISDIFTSKKEIQRLTGRIAALGRSCGLELARELRIEQVIIKSDSQLIVNQMQENYIAREARMQQYLENAQDLVRQFQTWKVTQIPREENAEADALANLASAIEVTNEENTFVIHLFHSVPDQDKNEKKDQTLRQKDARYCLDWGNLYQKIFGGPLARCLGHSQTEYVMKEIYEGHCENHAGGRSLVKTIISVGYYYPNMEEEAEHFVAKCDKCQRYVVNGQAKSTNKVIINNLKKKLEESNGKWPEVLPGVLWAYRTTAKTSMGETPFSLVYGAEALIPVEIGDPSTRYTQATEESNEEELWVNMDLLEERRETALIRMAAQKQVIERYYNRKARLRYFKIGDYVLKKVFQSTRAANAGKLSPNWEGPYKIRGIAGKCAYKLETLDGKILPSSWNDVHLKKYYF
ncbi:uncharacterized protein LOC142180991 [Nicotiana tabacum]|uniref:Uncharacterized protein LOC142180991 n=1 Tax=Nicotiana tabacum TaxID=4097 RepID=A0AC58UI90_TOBAC